MQQDPMWNEFIAFMFFISLLVGGINISILIVLIKNLSKDSLTQDDPSGCKKQKIYDDLDRVISDIKSTV